MHAALKNLGINVRQVGLLSLIGFTVISSAKTVFVGSVAQEISPILLAFVCFSIVSLFFGFWGKHVFLGKQSRVKHGFAPLLMLNLTTLGSWVSMFVGVKYLEPAINSAIGFGIGPLSTLVLLKLFRKSTPISRAEILGGVGVLISFALFLLASFSGLSAVGWQPTPNLSVGFLAALVMGVSIAGNTVFSKRLYDVGFKESEVLATRFVGVVIFCGLYVALSEKIQFASALPYLLPLTVSSLLGIVVPLYLLQVAIHYSEPMEISLLLPFCPLMVMLFQQWDGRLTFSPWSLVGLTLFAVVSVASVIYKQQGKPT